MIVSLIAAMSQNHVIGCRNAIPWDIPADRKHFRNITMGHPVIMGRKTFESLPGPLPGRQNILVTRQNGYRAEGCAIAHDLNAALKMAAEADEAFVIGGGEIYSQAMSLADRIYLTIVGRDYTGDTFFPEIPSDFITVREETAEGNIPCRFLLLTRKRP